LHLSDSKKSATGGRAAGVPPLSIPGLSCDNAPFVNEELAPPMNDFHTVLETFDNRYPSRDYKIEIVAPEFTSVCPKTGQPDFATLKIAYTPHAKCVELKSLKLYLQKFRNEGIFYEHVTNAILDDLVATLAPRWMKIEAAFNPRGGITETVTVQYASTV